MVIGVVPSFPRFLPSFFIAHKVQQSHCSSIFHRVLLTHALVLSASQSVVHKKKSQRMYTSMHSAGLEPTKKLTYARLEDNLIRHRGDRCYCTLPWMLLPCYHVPGIVYYHACYHVCCHVIEAVPPTACSYVTHGTGETKQNREKKQRSLCVYVLTRER